MEIPKCEMRKELTKARAEMKKKIFETVYDAIQDFRDKTGLSVSSVDCVMIEETSIGDTNPKYTLVGIGIETKL